MPRDSVFPVWGIFNHDFYNADSLLIPFASIMNVSPVLVLAIQCSSHYCLYSGCDNQFVKFRAKFTFGEWVNAHECMDHCTLKQLKLHVDGFLFGLKSALSLQMHYSVTENPICEFWCKKKIYAFELPNAPRIFQTLMQFSSSA